MLEYGVVNVPMPQPRHFHFKSRRPQEAHGVIANFFEPQFRLDVANRAGFEFSLQHFPCGPGVSISRLAFNADVTVQIDRVDAFMVQMPIAGRNELSLGGERRNRLSLNKRLFSVIGPERSLEQRRSPDCEMVLVRFNAVDLAKSLAAHIGEAIPASELAGLEFAVEMPVPGLTSSAWLRLTSYVLGELDKENSILRSPLAAAQAGQLLMSTLLLQQPHSHSNLLRGPADQASPRFIGEAEDYLHTNAERPITADDLARHLDISTRSVYAGFRRHLDTTPMQRLKDIRLDRAREDLLAGKGASVTTIAMTWGFTHLGNFSNDYRSRFGELPSQTLRAARASR
jgi:AraC-like DNA-binding protein